MGRMAANDHLKLNIHTLRSMKRNIQTKGNFQQLESMYKKMGQLTTIADDAFRNIGVFRSSAEKKEPVTLRGQISR